MGRVSAAHRRLLEQERLCMSFGGDWESLLAAERRRNIHRAAVVSMDSDSLQEQFGQFVIPPDDGDWTSSSSDGEKSCSNSSSSDSVDMVNVIDLEQALGDRAKDRCSIVMRCRKSGGAPAQQETTACAYRLTTGLKQMMVDVRQAEDIINSLSTPSMPQVHLRPMVAIDPEGGQNELLICARRSSPNTLDQVEWLTNAEFQARLHCLQDGSDGVARCGDGSPSMGLFSAATKSDVWKAVSEKVSKKDIDDGVQMRKEVADLRSERDSLAQEVAALRAARACPEALSKSTKSAIITDGSQDPLQKVRDLAASVALDLEGTIRDMDEVEIALGISSISAANFKSPRVVAEETPSLNLGDLSPDFLGESLIGESLLLLDDEHY